MSYERYSSYPKSVYPLLQQKLDAVLSEEKLNHRKNTK